MQDRGQKPIWGKKIYIHNWILRTGRSNAPNFGLPNLESVMFLKPGFADAVIQRSEHWTPCFDESVCV